MAAKGRHKRREFLDVFSGLRCCPSLAAGAPSRHKVRSKIFAFAGYFYSISRGTLTYPVGKAKLAYGDFYEFQYREAPWCCIYAGLTTNESASFMSVFTHFAQSYGIHKVVYRLHVIFGWRMRQLHERSCRFFCWFGPVKSLLILFPVLKRSPFAVRSLLSPALPSTSVWRGGRRGARFSFMCHLWQGGIAAFPLVMPWRSAHLYLRDIA